MGMELDPSPSKPTQTTEEPNRSEPQVPRARRRSKRAQLSMEPGGSATLQTMTGTGTDVVIGRLGAS